MNTTYSKKVHAFIPDADRTIVNPSYAQSEVHAYRTALESKNLVSKSLDVDDLCEQYRTLIMEGVEPPQAAHKLWPTVEKALVETCWASHAAALEKQFKISKEAAEKLVEYAKEQFKYPRRPAYETMRHRIYSHAVQASHDAFEARETKRHEQHARHSTMAAAMLEARVIQ